MKIPIFTWCDTIVYFYQKTFKYNRLRLRTFLDKEIVSGIKTLTSQNNNKINGNNMSLFYCKNCNLEFEAKNLRKYEFIDPVMGSCWAYVADCPQCKAECREKLKKKTNRKEKEVIPSCTECSCNSGCGFAEN